MEESKYFKNKIFRKIEEEEVNHPSHYTMGKVEVIDAIESWDLDFRLANVIKYIARAGKKDPSRKEHDLRKAKWYLDRFLRIEFEELE